VTQEQDNGTSITYGYDATSQLTSAGGTNYSYDATGNRTMTGYQTGTGSDDAAWPSEEAWNKLGRAVEGRLIKVKSPLSACRESPDSPACDEVFKALRNPYYIGDHVGLTQTSGWVGAWASRPNAYAVIARKTDDVVAAVNFARENKLRLVVKGGGAAGGPPAFPGIKGHEPNLNAAGRAASAVTKSMNKLLEVVDEPGSYVSESDFFESQWRRSYWGSNYPRLAAVKKKYDPDGLFTVHHGVGSEEWSADGFTRVGPS
jgi:hypothetical protein